MESRVTEEELDGYDDEFEDVEILDEEGPEEMEFAFGAAEFVSGLLVGVIAGAAVTLLFAPKAGTRTRRDIGRRVRRLQSNAEDRWDHAHRDIRKQVRRGKRRIKGKIDKAAKRTRKAVKRLT